MKTWVILILLLVSNGKSIASDNDLLEDGRGVHRLIPVSAYERNTYEDSPFVKEDVVLPIKPQSKSHLHCCRTERGKAVLSSLGRITPSLAMATTGVILLELAKQQYLEAEVFQALPRMLIQNYNKFFFPTSLFSSQNVGQITAFSMTLYEAINITALWVPTAVVTVGECIKMKYCRYENYPDNTNANAVKMRMIMKGLAMGTISIGGTVYLMLNYNFWGKLFNQNTPRVLEQFNLTGAIELCKKLPDLGLSSKMSPYDFLTRQCSASLLKDLLVPSRNGLPWSYCERVLTGLSVGNYITLTVPLLLMFLNMLYFVAWI